jgi:hypothetical protein
MHISSPPRRYKTRACQNLSFYNLKYGANSKITKIIMQFFQLPLTSSFLGSNKYKFPRVIRLICMEATTWCFGDCLWLHHQNLMWLVTNWSTHIRINNGCKRSVWPVCAIRYTSSDNVDRGYLRNVGFLFHIDVAHYLKKMCVRQHVRPDGQTNYHNVPQRPFGFRYRQEHHHSVWKNSQDTPAGWAVCDVM